MRRQQFGEDRDFHRRGAAVGQDAVIAADREAQAVLREAHIREALVGEIGIDEATTGDNLGLIDKNNDRRLGVVGKPQSGECCQESDKTIHGSFR